MSSIQEDKLAREIEALRLKGEEAQKLYRPSFFALAGSIGFHAISIISLLQDKTTVFWLASVASILSFILHRSYHKEANAEMDKICSEMDELFHKYVNERMETMLKDFNDGER